MKNTLWDFLVSRQKEPAFASQVVNALNDAELAWLFDQLNQLDGGVPDPDRPAALDSWKTSWSAEDLIEYARTGNVPVKFCKAS